MNVVFYSSNSNFFEGNDFDIKRIPSEAQSWEALVKEFPDINFTVITQLPGTFLLDIQGNNIEESLQKNNPKIKFLLSSAKDAPSFADEILLQDADLAIAASFWVRPFDWLSLEDALIASLLRDKGIHVLCNSQETALCCMDKGMTQSLFEKAGLAFAKGFTLDLQLFRAERSHKEMRNNVYREFILTRLRKLTYPIVIKSTTGLSSYGMGLAVSFKQALAYLDSGKTNSDRIIEEYIEGDQAGAEVYGKDGHYKILPPFLFSVSRWGLTSPKQSIKAGPITNEKYKLDQLYEMLLKAAKEIKLNGIMQVDLVFSKGKWFIIEINPRISGMSETYAEAMGTSVKKMLLQTALGKKIESPLAYTINFKLPLLTDEQMQSLAKEENVLMIRQNRNKAARQEREKGYCEIIFGKRNSVADLEKDLDRLSCKYPTFFEEDFLVKAKDLLAKM